MYNIQYVKPLLNLQHIISYKHVFLECFLSDANTHKKKRRSKYAIYFNTADLHSIRRSDPKLTWSYAVFILKDGTTLPALHFHSGGISEMIRRLQRYIWLTKLVAHIDFDGEWKVHTCAVNTCNIIAISMLHA